MEPMTLRYSPALQGLGVFRAHELPTGRVAIEATIALPHGKHAVLYFVARVSNVGPQDASVPVMSRTSGDTWQVQPWSYGTAGVPPMLGLTLTGAPEDGFPPP